MAWHDFGAGPGVWTEYEYAAVHPRITLQPWENTQTDPRTVTFYFAPGLPYTLWNGTMSPGNTIPLAPGDVVEFRSLMAHPLTPPFPNTEMYEITVETVGTSSFTAKIPLADVLSGYGYVARKVRDLTLPLSSIKIMLSELCNAVNERLLLIGESPVMFRYGNGTVSKYTAFTPSDFDGFPLRGNSTEGTDPEYHYEDVSPLKYNLSKIVEFCHLHAYATAFNYYPPLHDTPIPPASPATTPTFLFDGNERKDGYSIDYEATHYIRINQPASDFLSTRTYSYQFLNITDASAYFASTTDPAVIQTHLNVVSTGLVVTPWVPATTDPEYSVYLSGVTLFKITPSANTDAPYFYNLILTETETVIDGFGTHTHYRAYPVTSILLEFNLNTQNHKQNLGIFYNVFKVEAFYFMAYFLDNVIDRMQDSLMWSMMKDCLTMLRMYMIRKTVRYNDPDGTLSPDSRVYTGKIGYSAWSSYLIDPPNDALLASLTLDALDDAVTSAPITLTTPPDGYYLTPGGYSTESEIDPSDDSYYRYRRVAHLLTRVELPALTFPTFSGDLVFNRLILAGLSATSELVPQYTFPKGSPYVKEGGLTVTSGGTVGPIAVYLTDAAWSSYTSPGIGFVWFNWNIDPTADQPFVTLGDGVYTELDGQRIFGNFPEWFKFEYYTIEALIDLTNHLTYG